MTVFAASSATTIPRPSQKWPCKPHANCFNLKQFGSAPDRPTPFYLQRSVNYLKVKMIAGKSGG
jgi:hypothetical protein